MKGSKPKILFNVIFLTFISMTLLIPTATAADIIVPDDGYTKIQDAINAASPGDTVYVKAGKYSPSTNEEVFPIYMDDGISLVGEGADACTLDAEGTNVVIAYYYIDDMPTRLEGFTITNGYSYGLGGGIYCLGSSPTIANNIITENGTDYVGGGIWCDWYSYPNIINNVISANSAYWGGGINCTHSSPTIANNIITGNSATYGAGICFYYDSSPVITNNTIIKNSAGNYGGGILCAEASPLITNTIITGNIANRNGGGICCYYDCSLNIIYSDVWNNTPNDYYALYGEPCGPGEGCISIDPLFVNPDADDYHLQPTSPCIDTGNNGAPGLPDTDFEGNPRILDGDNDEDAIVDMGAFEYLGVTEVSIDIKPGSCPNPLNTKNKGVLPVAILGTEDFDPTDIDPTTVLLSREVCGDGVTPIRWSYEDVATPFEGEECDCYDLNGDGYLDLTLKFNVQEVLASLGDVNDGEVITLTITGNLKEEAGSTPFEGSDCIIVLKKGKTGDIVLIVWIRGSY